MQRLRISRMSAALTLAAISAAVAAAQPAPTGPQLKVIVAGANPAIRLLDKEGGKAIASANFWRVDWSPAGAGAICYITVDSPEKDHLKIAIYDNKELLDYVTNELMSSLTKTFNVPPFTPLKGTITQTNNGATDRTETCKSGKYNVKLVWKGLGQGQWVDMKMGGAVNMTFTMVPASGGEIWINGKMAPGTWFPTGGGIGPGAFLTANETWRR